MRIQEWPFEWFFNGKVDFINENYYEDLDEDVVNGRVNWRNLRFLGWNSESLENLEYSNYSKLPNHPGIYVIAHEHEVPTLYVGQSENVKKRISNRGHHKISGIINLFEACPWGTHDAGNSKAEIIIFWKTLPTSCKAENIRRWLVWCEAISIGFLCPLMQGGIKDVIEKDWAIGRGMYS